MREATDTKEKIRNAAARLMASGAAGRFTLDAVAKNAGVSKGGLLYHFPSKQALVESMLEQLLEQRAGFHSSTGGGTSVASPGKLLAELADHEFHMDSAEREYGQAILAAAVQDRDLLKPATTYISDLFSALGRSGTDPSLAQVLLLAIEGLQLLELLGLLTTTAADRDRLAVRLKQLAAGLD